MKVFFLNTIILVFFTFTFQRLSAQNSNEQTGYVPGFSRCGATEYLELKRQMDPGFEARVKAIEDKTNEWLKNPPPVTQAVIYIPVVLHVVYKNTNENIPDVYLLQLIDRMNLDYGKTNSDWTNTPAAFQSHTANTQIQFCLASTDENGSPTTGITRTSTTVAEFSSMTDYIKFTAKGGIDGWDYTKFLNIWIGDLGSGKLGYSTMPGWGSNDDGVVMHFASLPGPPTIWTKYDLGRTASHEVGHWFNLSHIWGDASCGNDNVSDTPTQQSENYGCPSFPKVSCSNGPNGAMFMNYMDYVDDPCMVMFTAGQAARMIAAINADRPGLKTSAATHCSGTTGTAENNISNNIFVYPNPASGEVIITSGQVGAVGYKIYNAMGQMIISEDLSGPSAEIKINLTDKLNGIYLFEIWTSEGVIIRKVLLNR